MTYSCLVFLSSAKFDQYSWVFIYIVDENAIQANPKTKPVEEASPKHRQECLGASPKHRQERLLSSEPATAWCGPQIKKPKYNETFAINTVQNV